EAVGGVRLDPATAHPDRVKDLGPLVAASGFFEEPVTRRHLFTVDFTANAYATNVSTQSGIKDFEPGARAELVARIPRRVEPPGRSQALTAAPKSPYRCLGPRRILQFRSHGGSVTIASTLSLRTRSRRKSSLVHLTAPRSARPPLRASRSLSQTDFAPTSRHA